MYREVKDYIDICERCAMGRAPVIHTTSNYPLASRPLEILAIDFTKMETASDGKEDVLVLTDVFTKFSLAIPASNQETVTIAKVLVRDWFQRYRVPQRIDSDQGRNFESKLVSAFCELYGIHKSRTMPYHPRGNAQCERFNRSLHDLQRSLPSELKTKWPQYLPELVQAYNNTPHASTRFLPHFLLFGQEPQLPVDYPLGREAPSAVGPTDWVRQHRLWLQDANAIALKQLRGWNRQTRGPLIIHLTLVILSTWETGSSAGAKYKIDGVLVFTCMQSSRLQVDRNGPSVETICCMPEPRWRFPEMYHHKH